MLFVESRTKAQADAEADKWTGHDFSGNNELSHFQIVRTFSCEIFID